MFNLAKVNNVITHTLCRKYSKPLKCIQEDSEAMELSNTNPNFYIMLYKQLVCVNGFNVCLVCNVERTNTVISIHPLQWKRIEVCRKCNLYKAK